MASWEEKEAIRKDIEGGGIWLREARTWMQNNIRFGDTLTWSCSEPVTIPFSSLEKFAKEVAIAAIAEDREKREREANRTD
jgi:hypothetical protein